MPSTGTPSSYTAGGARGGFASVTDSGPPERITPRARKARTSASLTSQGWISQYTPSSRTRRAMSCVYCAPKSRIRMRCAWMSACGALPAVALPACVALPAAAAAVAWGMPAGRGTLAMGSGHAVVGGFLGDADVVHVALADAGGGDGHEHRARGHMGDVAAAGIAHGPPQSARQLTQDGDHAPLVGNAPLHAFRHQLLELGGRVLEITIRRAVAFAHRAERAHAAIGLVGSSLVQLDVTGGFLGAGEQAADHDRMRARRDRLGDVPREADAAIGDDRHVRVAQRLRDRGNRGDLRYADARDDARGADRAWPDADLDGVRAGIDQAPGRPRGRAVR